MRRRAASEHGRQELEIDVPGVGALAATLIVGKRPGPRAFVVGGATPEDTLGFQVRRDLVWLIDPDRLRGSLLILPLVPRKAMRPLLRGVLADAPFGVEVHAPPAGWKTVDHVRADLSDPAARRLARGFGVDTIVDAPAKKGSFRSLAARRGVPVVAFEGGEHVASWGCVSLLDVARMVRGGRRRPMFRAVVDSITRVRARGGACVVPAATTLVDAGEPLAELYDERGARVRVIPAKARSLVLAVSATPLPGEWVARVGRLASFARLPRPAARPGPETIGWCEWVALPELGVPMLHAKIDTGARTSAIHVANMKDALAKVHVLEWVVVRDSGGHDERRPLIETTMVLGTTRRKIRVTLTDRGDMRFPMLVGRTALADHFVVDPTARDLLGKPAVDT